MKKIETILLIDDDIDDREIFKEAMARVNPSIHCYSAIDSEDALLMLDNSLILPDIIFLDLNMPRIDGLQCLAEIKKNQKLNKIPIIIYSTSTLKKNMEETKSLGATQFITKPYDFPELCQSLSEAIATQAQTGA